MKQVLINLVKNALKFSQGGGTVSLQACFKDDFLVVHVKETGRGIEKEDI